MGGFSIGYGISVSPRLAVFDPDALAYFTTAGITDNTAKTQINDFVVGIKDLGLWSSMVSWPLRSSQNAGTGTTAFSLGGLQTSNATMSGGSWLADGFSLSGSQFGSSTLSSLSQDVTLLICARGDGSAYASFPQMFGVQSQSGWSGNQICIGSNNANSEMGTLHRNSVSSAAYSGNGANPLNSSTSFSFLGGNARSAVVLNYRVVSSGTLVSGTSASSGSATLDRMQLNGRWVPPQFGGLSLANPMVCAFCAIITPNINGSESSIYSLYKSTLGQGLGLP